jgi:hypothetical protein
VRRAGIAATALALSWSMAVPAPAQEPETPEARALTADEDFELNIADRRITEENFEASTALEIRTGQSEEQGLAVRVGALIAARRIDVQLRNVRGRVRFVASLEEVQEVIESHRTEAAAR